MMMYGNQWGWSMLMLMPVIWLVLVGLIVWAVVHLTRTSGHDHDAVAHATGHREGPQEILDRRFASGEIDAETYTQLREHLADRNWGPS